MCTIATCVRSFEFTTGVIERSKSDVYRTILLQVNRVVKGLGVYVCVGEGDYNGIYDAVP